MKCYHGWSKFGMEIQLISDNDCKIGNLYCPNVSTKLTSNVGFTINVGDTT